MVSKLLDENTANIEKAKSLTAGLSAAQMNWRPQPGEMVHRAEPRSPELRRPASRHYRQFHRSRARQRDHRQRPFPLRVAEQLDCEEHGAPSETQVQGRQDYDAVA